MNSKHPDFVHFDIGYRRALAPMNTAYGPAWYQIREWLKSSRSNYQWAITRNAPRSTRMQLIGQITALKVQAERHPVPAQYANR